MQLDGSGWTLAAVAALAALLAASCFVAPAATAEGPAAEAAPATGELAALVAAIEATRVGRTVEVDGPIRLGRATFEPGTGGARRLLLAGDEPVGLLLTGPWRLTYVVEDRFSQPVARRNVRRASSITAREEGGDLVLREDVKSAAIWSWQLAATAAGEGAAETGEGDGLPAGLEAISEDLWVTPSHELLIERGSRHTGPGAAYALIEGAREDLMLQVDPVVERHESLHSLGSSRRSRGFYNLADQPIGRLWWDSVEAPLVVVDRSISLLNPDGGSRLRVSTRSTVRSSRGDTSLWRVLLGTARKDADDRELEVRVDGRPADHVRHAGELLVDLGRVLPKGETATVEVVHEGDFLRRPNNDSYWVLSAWGWYPLPLAFNGELATMEIEVRVPEPFTPFASGKTVERREEDGFHVLRTRLDRAARYAVVAAGKYHVFTAERDGIEANVATYAFGHERAAAVLHGLFFGAADVLGQLLGVPYPFDEVDIVEINQLGWGQAPPGVIFITREAFDPIGDRRSRAYSRGVNARFVHEVAHAWWGHVIKPGSAEENWLSESFADYSAAVALQAMHGGKRGDQEFASIFREWETGAQQIGDGGSIYLAGYLAGEDDSDARDRFRLLYRKGPLVLHALRQELGRRLGGEETGDRYFLALLRTFLTNFTDQHGETRHLVGILNQMTGDDWQPWFERYVYGTEMPPVKL